MTQWKTIDSAPKDSQWLLLWNANGWQLGFRRHDGSWFIEGSSNPPTHWMSLPEPPEPPEKQP